MTFPGSPRDVFRVAEKTPLSQLLPRPWRIEAAADTFRPGLVATAKFAPLRVLGVKVPIEITQIRPGREIRYRYLRGGVSRGENSINFAPGSSADGRPVTHVVHTSNYRITAPYLRLAPMVYRIIHRWFVEGLFRRLGARL